MEKTPAAALSRGRLRYSPAADACLAIAIVAHASSSSSAEARVLPGVRDGIARALGGGRGERGERKCFLSSSARKCSRAQAHAPPHVEERKQEGRVGC